VMTPVTTSNPVSCWIKTLIDLEAVLKIRLDNSCEASKTLILRIN
jgi:hypothetical protein